MSVLDKPSEGSRGDEMVEVSVVELEARWTTRATEG